MKKKNSNNILDEILNETKEYRNLSSKNEQLLQPINSLNKDYIDQKDDPIFRMINKPILLRPKLINNLRSNTPNVNITNNNNKITPIRIEIRNEENTNENNKMENIKPIVKEIDDNPTNGIE